MKPAGNSVSPHFEVIAIGAATVGVIVAMFLPGLAIGFVAIAGIVRWLNRRDTKRPPDAP